MYACLLTCLSSSLQTKGRRKKATTGAGEGGLDWAVEEENALRLFASLLELDLHLLWDPPSVAIMDSYSKWVSPIRAPVTTACVQ